MASWKWRLMTDAGTPAARSSSNAWKVGSASRSSTEVSCGGTRLGGGVLLDDDGVALLRRQLVLACHARGLFDSRSAGHVGPGGFHGRLQKDGSLALVARLRCRCRAARWPHRTGARPRTSWACSTRARSWCRTPRPHRPEAPKPPQQQDAPTGRRPTARHRPCAADA